MFLCVFWIRDGKEERDGKKEKNESRFEVLIKEEEGKKKLAVERRVRWRAKQEKKKKRKGKKDQGLCRSQSESPTRPLLHPITPQIRIEGLRDKGRRDVENKSQHHARWHCFFSL